MRRPRYPRWFADGRQIAFHQIDDSGKSRLYLADLSANGDARNVRPFTDGPFDIEPAPSPDGRRIAYHSAAPDGRVSVRILDQESGESTDISCADIQDDS